MRGKLVWKEKSCKQWHRKKNSCGGQKKNHVDTSAKKKKQNKIRGPKKFCPLPVISTLHSLIIIWRLWQRFFSWRQSGARTTPTVWNWFGRTVCPFLFISWTLFHFFRPFTVSLSSLALRGWLLISRRLVCLFLHWSVDTMTSLLMQLKTICSVQSVTYRWKIQCRRNVATDAAKRAFWNTSKGLHFLLTRNDYCSYHYVVCMCVSRSILSRVMFGSEWSFLVAYTASQFQFTSGNSDT